MLKSALKRDPSLVETARLRRLFHESCTVVAADLRAQVEQADKSGLRKLPENAERLKAQQAGLQGVSVAVATEPGDALVARAVAMYDADRVAFIDWLLLGVSMCDRNRKFAALTSAVRTAGVMPSLLWSRLRSSLSALWIMWRGQL